MNKIISSFIGILLGLLYCIIIYGNKKENSIPNLSINFGSLIRNGHIYIFNKHIHHWLIFTIIILLSFNHRFQQIINKKYIYVIRGFSIVMILQGLSYKDWYKF